jgi:hypothetical protein
MPTKDTKVVAIRIDKKDYYDWLALASLNQQPISVYMKSFLDGILENQKKTSNINKLK